MKIFGKTPSIKLSLITPILLLLIGIVFANLVAWQQRIDNQNELQVLFDEEAKTLVDSTLFYIQTYKYGLLGARGVMVAHGDNSISRKAFKTYVASRNLDIEYPGAHGFGFIRKVAQEQEADFLKQARADDMPDFAIKQFAPHNGDRYVIQYIEPADRNRLAIGLDIASESARRTAAHQAMETGDAILTSPITLVQSSGLVLRSFLLLLPIYHLEMPLDTVEQREAATLGWSYAPIEIGEVLDYSGLSTDKQIAVQITDVSANQNRQRFYSPNNFGGLTQVSLKTEFQRNIFGRTWQFNLHAEPAFYRSHEKLSPLLLASFIVCCAFLLSLLLYFYLTNSQRMMAELQERNRLAAIVDNATDAIISLDLNRVVISWNNAAYLMFDFTAKEAVGKKICELIICDEMLQYKEDFLSKVRRGEPLSRFETVRKTRSGNQINVSVTPFLIKDKNGNIAGIAETLTDISEEKRNHELFKLAIEVVRDAIIITNENNIITLLNKHAVELLGYVKEELLGQNIRILIPFRNRERYDEQTEQFYLHRHPLIIGIDSQNLAILHKNGSEIPVEIQLSPFKVQDDNFTLVALSDLRSRKKLQSELQTSLERMKMAVSSMNLGIWQWQLEDNQLIWDERMFEIYDAPKNLAETGVYYEFWRSCVHPDDFAYAEKKLLGAISGADVYNPEFRIVLKNGEIRYLQAAAIVERDVQGKVIQMVGINVDISERKQNEQALRQLTTNLELKVIERTQAFLDLYHQAPCSYHSLDLHGKILQANQTGLDLLGYTPEEYVGHNIVEFLTPEGIETFKHDFPKFLKIGKIHNLEYDVICKDGNTIAFLINASLVRDAQGQPLYINATLIDHRERKIKDAQIAQLNTDLIRRAEEAESATRAKTDFLSNMSHEIRTPLNAVLGLAYLLQKTSLSPEAQNMVGKIDLAGRSLLGIINSCLDFSKIESTLLTLEAVPFQLTDVFNNLSNIMSAAAGAKNIELLIAPLPKAANYLIGDPTRLGQILMNLAGNAIKFTAQGEVIVKLNIVQQDVENHQIRLRFSVSDTGIGIPLDKQETIFQPFSQADTSTSRVYGGTGLGLSISRHLVELMGGHLQLNSQIGVGSEFFFELTFALGEIENDVGCHLIKDMPHQTLLIVDDNPTACSILKAMTQDLGWDAHSVDSGEKAVKIVLEKGANYFDLLLIDWKMPDMDGLQTAVEIRTQLGEKHSPMIIMVTAYDRITLLEHPSSQFIDAVVSKPVTSSTLFDTILEVTVKKGALLLNNTKCVDGERLKNITILVVDDNETNREVAYQILTGEGAVVELAENGQEAIVRLQANPELFQIVLMDVQMPVMDGYTATRQLRSIAELKNLPIIALTAGAFKSQRDAALKAGMNDFVGKPFTVDDLVACVEKLTCSLCSAKTPATLISETVAASPAQIDFSKWLLIDVALGLKAWHDEEIYKKTLWRFLEQNSQQAAHIQEVLLNNPLEIAQAAVHKLQGSAGALSLTRLMKMLAQMELELYKGENAQQLIAQFMEISAQTSKAIESYVDSNHKPSRTQSFADKLLSEHFEFHQENK